ncbi:MAG TPA: efflux RND transporter periplasmic adaptor subunit [Verrucomicrobiae bacterium]|jgi:cobalt-zinc-cadmium efflux system membrane fusion protein
MRHSLYVALTILAAAGPLRSQTAAPAEQSVDLTLSQLNAIKIEPIGTHVFREEKQALGSIGFDDDLSVQVYPPYQGKLLKTFVDLGDEVKSGQSLYTIDSPDLVQAESTLISAAASFELTRKELERVTELSTTNGISQRESEQAASDHQTAQGALNAAQDSLRIFGKTDAEVNEIITKRQVDSGLIVRSPLTGQVTAMNAPPGILAQPGTPPAPYSVADVSVKWLLAQVIEIDSPLFHAGQSLEAKVTAYPDRGFTGKISKIYPTVDPTTHRVTIRSEINDPQHELRPGMLATFTIQIHDPIEATGIPVNGIVRNGNGTMAAWVTTDRHHFVQRIVKIGLQTDEQYQILDGLKPGELAVTDGAIFLSNILYSPPSD